MSTPEILGIVSAVLQIAGYASYYRYTIRGDIRPNAASWLIWFYGNLVICISYLLIGEFSLAGLLPIACAITNIALVVLLWRRGHFGPIEPQERKYIYIDVAITILWLLLEFTALQLWFLSYISLSVPVFIHILLLSSAAVSFIPLLRETASERCAEHVQPWIIWSCAYSLWFVAEIMINASWQLLYPALYLLLHATVVGILVYKRSCATCQA
jgi:hypothetical protein